MEALHFYLYAILNTQFKNVYYLPRSWIVVNIYGNWNNSDQVMNCAGERTWTSTGVTPLAPKASASANFATPAIFKAGASSRALSLQEQYTFRIALRYAQGFRTLHESSAFSHAKNYLRNFCASSRARTCDLILKRDLLYQLSYGRI